MYVESSTREFWRKEGFVIPEKESEEWKGGRPWTDLDVGGVSERV